MSTVSSGHVYTCSLAATALLDMHLQELPELAAAQHVYGYICTRISQHLK
jgi:hypothetical protein